MVRRRAEKINMQEFIDLPGGLRIPLSELSFTFARSGGPGGQNVNKVATRVELQFDIDASQSLDGRKKELLRTALAHRLGPGTILRIRSDASRSQWENRRDALRKFSRMLARALLPPRKRVASSPTRASRLRRLNSKKRTGALKRSRGRIDGDEAS